MKPSSEIVIHAQSLEQTQALAEALGRVLTGGIHIALSGDLGAGKTSFVQGLARGLSVPGNYYVTSPTYNIINEYPGRHTLFHIDLYRIEEIDELEEIGFAEIAEGDGVLAVEWAEKLEGDLTFDLSVELSDAGPEARKIRIIAYGLEASNLISNLDL